MIIETYNQFFELAKSARKQLAKQDVWLIEQDASATPGDFLRIFSGCLLNRQIDIFDDTILLLQSDRVQAACTVSRAMIETSAFGNHLYSKVERALGSGISRDAVDAALQLVIKFTNSSRYKVNEQEKVAKGRYSLDDYVFTVQARERMAMGLAASEHVMNALREFYKEEKNITGSVESRFEMAYDILSEWVHPSQTSVFHHYVKETQAIPSSIGDVNLFDAARFHCSVALYLIVDASNRYEWAQALAKDMDSDCEC